MLPEEAAPVVPIRVTVRAAGLKALNPDDAGRSLSSEAIRWAVVNYAGRLATDLGLPGSVEASIEATNDEDVPKELPFLMTIVGKAARLNLRRAPGPLDEHVPFEIYRNRSWLVTPALVAADARRIWGAVELPDSSAERLLGAARLCVERNISLERLRIVLAQHDPTALPDLWELVFTTHGEEDLQVAISFDPERHREHLQDEQGWRKKFLDLQEQIFEQLGLLCPIPEMRGAPELSSGEWYFRLNDVRLPIARTTQIKEAAAEIVPALRGQLRSEPQLLFTRHGVERALEFLRESSPALVEQVLARVGLNAICCLLEGLVREGFPVKSLGRILDMLTFARGSHRVDTSKYMVFTSDAETPIWTATQGDAPLTAEDYLCVVRTNLKREITYRYAQNWKPGSAPNLEVYLLDAEIEKRIQGAIKRPFTGRERLRLIRSFLNEELQARWWC